MKRGWTKKIKAVPACAASNDALEGRCKPVQPKVKRRVRTSAAMIGLVILMGAPNLLLTRQSDRAPAAEPVGDDDSTISTVPTTTEAIQSSNISSVAQETVSVDKTGSASAIAPPTAQVQVKAEMQSAPVKVYSIEATPLQPVIEHTVPKVYFGQDQKYQVEEANKETLSVRSSYQKVRTEGASVGNLTQSKAIASDAQVVAPTNSNTQQAEIQSPQLLQTDRAARLVQRLKARESERLSKPSEEVASTQVTPSPVITAANQPLVDDSVTINSKVDSRISANQRILINRLKQKSYRPQDTLNSVQSGESNTSSTSTLPMAQKLTRASVDVLIVDTKEEKNTASISPISNKTAVFGLQQPAATPESIDGIVNEQLAPNQNAALIAPQALGTPTENISERSLDVVTSQNQLAAPPESIDGIANEQLQAPNSNAALITPQTLGTPTENISERSLDVVTSNENTDIEAQNAQPNPDIFVVPDEAAVNELVVEGTPSSDYQVKAGDTLSAIARVHSIPLSDLVKANQLRDPDLLEINQRIKIPTSQYSSTIGQTITVINRPTDSDRTASTVNQTVFVVPPLSSANTSIASVPQLPISTVSGEPVVGSAYTGMGGSISDEAEQLTTSADNQAQLANSTATTEPQSNLYAQDLQTDIQKLRQKYYSPQHRDGQLVSISETKTIATTVPAHSTSSTAAIRSYGINPQISSNEPINPEFRVAQAAVLQPTSHKQASTQPSSNTAPTTKARLATAPASAGVSESIGSFRGRQVSPELPPLGGADTYLPKPTSAPLKGYIWPAKGVLTSGYGWRWGRMHKGIDVAAPIGTPIVAAAPGVVVRAGWNSGGYGKLVDIKHADGTLTRYAHNNRILVQAGQQVEQGQRISEMGNTGFSTGPHLHFEVHPGGKGAVNPIAFLPGR